MRRFRGRKRFGRGRRRRSFGRRRGSVGRSRRSSRVGMRQRIGWRM